MIALRRSAAVARCVVRSAAEQDTPHGRRAVAHVVCPDGWGAARFLLAQSIADSRTAAARILALEIRRGARSEEDFARAVFRYVQDRVQFVREPGEVFARADYTLASGGGDCDDHARVVYALLRAGGLPARLNFLFQRGDRGPRHVVAQALLSRWGWTWLETTAAAEFGEHPYKAALRLGIIGSRNDIASEERPMTEKDLGPIPSGFEHRTTSAQFAKDVGALRTLGFLCDASAPSSVIDPDFRRAVLAVQRTTVRTSDDDGLIGPETRGLIAAMLPQGEGIGYLGDIPRSFTHAQARAALRSAYVAQFGREPTAGELDFGLATAYFETFYGRGTGAAWGDGGQFGRWAADGKINWGALETATPGEERTLAKFRAAGLHPTKEAGRDAGNLRYFYLFPSDEEAARAFLMSWGQPDTLAAAATGSATAVAASMKRHGYYEGFHVAPGAMGGKKSPPFIQETSAADAEAKNIADYASALARTVRTVGGTGGVPDPSPLPSSTGGVANTIAALLLVGGTVATAWWLAGQQG